MFDVTDIIVTSLHDLPDQCTLGSHCSKFGDSDLPCEGHTNQNCVLLWFGITVNSTDPNPPSDI